MQQPRVLNGNYRLIRKGGHQLNLFLGERLNLVFKDDNDPDEVIASKHRHSEYCPRWLDVAERVTILGILLQVGYWIDRRSSATLAVMV